MNKILQYIFMIVLFSVGIILIIKGVTELIVLIYNIDLKTLLLLAIIYILCNIGLYTTGFKNK